MGNGEGGVRISKKPVQLELAHAVQLEKKASDSYDLFYSGLCSLLDGRIAVVDRHNKICVILHSSLQPLSQPYTLDNRHHEMSHVNRLTVTLPLSVY